MPCEKLTFVIITSIEYLLWWHFSILIILYYYILILTLSWITSKNIWKQSNQNQLQKNFVSGKNILTPGQVHFACKINKKLEMTKISRVHNFCLHVPFSRLSSNKTICQSSGIHHGKGVFELEADFLLPCLVNYSNKT